jgi:hypothetical protein
MNPTPTQLKIFTKKANEVETAFQKANSIKTDFITVFDDEIIRRILLISELLTIHMDEPESSSDEFYIPFGAIRIGAEGIKKQLYPFSCYKISTARDNKPDSSVQINVRVRSFSRSEVDNFYLFMFPADEDEFSLYIEQLQKAAFERGNKIREKKQIYQNEKLEEERREYERLKQKFEEK